MANTSSVDGRSAFLIKPAQHNHVDYSKSFAKFSERGLPSKIPAENVAAIKRDPNLVEFERQALQLEAKNATRSEIKAARSKARNCRNIITWRSLQQYQLEWVRRRRDWKVMIRGKERPDDDERMDFLEILSLVMSELSRLARTMISNKVVFEKERRQAIEDLCSLASQDCTGLYRPGEKLVNGICPAKGCGAEIMKYNHHVFQIFISLMVAVYAKLDEVHIHTAVVAKSWHVPFSEGKQN